MNKELNLESLKKRIQLYELIFDLLLFFVLIPYFLVLVYYSSLNSVFSLYTANPNVVTIYFSNFAHSDFNHLRSNIISYFIIFFLIYVTQKLLNVRERRDFYIDMIFIYIVVPFVVSIYNISKYPNNNINAFIGFSGIDSALIGYFVAIFILYVYKKANVNITKFSILNTYSLDISIKLLILEIFVYNIKIKMIFISLIILVILMLNKADIKNIYLNLNKNEKNGDIEKYQKFLYLCLGFLVYLLSVILWLVLFPANPLTDSGNKINIGGHFVGYYSGILIPYLWVNLKKCIE